MHEIICYCFNYTRADIARDETNQIIDEPSP